MVLDSKPTTFFTNCKENIKLIFPGIAHIKTSGDCFFRFQSFSILNYRRQNWIQWPNKVLEKQISELVFIFNEFMKCFHPPGAPLKWHDNAPLSQAQVLNLLSRLQFNLKQVKSHQMNCWFWWEGKTGVSEKNTLGQSREPRNLVHNGESQRLWHFANLTLNMQQLNSFFCKCVKPAYCTLEH